MPIRSTANGHVARCRLGRRGAALAKTAAMLSRGADNPASALARHKRGAFRAYPLRESHYALYGKFFEVFQKSKT
jgi:hypothetical protein